MTTDRDELLNYLGRTGGAPGWQYYWSGIPMVPPIWYPVGKPPKPPEHWKAYYYNVNPAIRQVFGTKRGGIANVASVNCLYAEFDATPKYDKMAILGHIEKLPMAPSVLVDSGGGVHAYWLLTDPVTLTNNNRDELRDIQARWVAFVGADTSAKDLARVLRLPGTQNKKYDPPRPVTFIEADFTATYKLDELAALLPAAQERPEFKNDGPPPDPTDAADYWLQRALQEARPGNRNETGFWLAAQLRDGGVTQSAARDIMRAYQGSVDTYPPDPYTEHEAQASLASAYNGTPRDPAPIKKSRTKKPMDENLTIPNNSSILTEVQGLGTEIKITEVKAPTVIAVDLGKPPPQVPEQPQKRKTVYTAAELMAAEFPEPNWIIPSLIPEGLAIIGGRPKVGKSWLALQMCISVGSGGKFFDKQIEPGEVLFIALEDNPRRLQKRIQDMGITTIPPITFMFEHRPLHQGGIDDLYAAIISNRYRLISLDPLNRAFIGIDQNDSPMIPKLLSQLQTATMQQNSTLLFTDHTRKPSAFNPDPIDDIIAQTGKTSIADVILALYKTQGKAGANLKGRGRDIEDVDLSIKWDLITHTWQLVGEAGEVALTEVKNDILALLEESNLTLAEICKGLGRTTTERGNIYKYMTDLINLGRVIKLAPDKNNRVYYELHIPI